jgi:anti-sigma regulatory factor (Ser/Thr protein kinase)
LTVAERVVIQEARRETPAALDWIETRGRAAEFSEHALLELRVVAEEVLTNIAKYAYAPEVDATVEMRISFRGTVAVLELLDQGMAFDPLAQSPPDLDAPLEERPLVVLGLTLLRALVDEVRYVREGTTNVLRLVKRVAAHRIPGRRAPHPGRPERRKGRQGFQH